MNKLFAVAGVLASVVLMNAPAQAQSFGWLKHPYFKCARDLQAKLDPRYRNNEQVLEGVRKACLHRYPMR